MELSWGENSVMRFISNYSFHHVNSCLNILIRLQTIPLCVGIIDIVSILGNSVRPSCPCQLGYVANLIALIICLYQKMDRGADNPLWRFVTVATFC